MMLLDRTQLDTPKVVVLLWTRDQPDAEPSTCQNTTLITDRHPCPRRDSNPQSYKTSGRWLTPHGRAGRRDRRCYCAEQNN